MADSDLAKYLILLGITNNIKQKGLEKGWKKRRLMKKRR